MRIRYAFLTMSIYIITMSSIFYFSFDFFNQFNNKITPLWMFVVILFGAFVPLYFVDGEEYVEKKKEG